MYNGRPQLAQRPFSPAAAQNRQEDLILTEAAPLPEILEESASPADESLVIAQNVEIFEDEISTTTLDEVVVTGLGVSRRNALSGSVAMIDHWSNNTLLNNGLIMQKDLEDAIPELQN